MMVDEMALVRQSQVSSPIFLRFEQGGNPVTHNIGGVKSLKSCFSRAMMLIIDMVLAAPWLQSAT